ncbi:efflux RND transporter periplasmic adaptor subunit [Roseateles sp.]|uniref:efflux RND transporter periplasmic adaptor subunit n=1 Tax=Roseateles sp. TaxID=1971397 RepID=UPI0039427C8E
MQSFKIVLVLLAAAILAACGKPPAQPEPLRAVRTVVVASGMAAQSHEYAAEVRARIESRLAFRVPGKLLQREVNLGDSVKAGQVLARIDSKDLVLARGAAEAAVAAARTGRDQAGADYKRFVELQQKGFISAAELERRDSAFKAAQAQLDQARAQADAQVNQAAYAQLVADVAGVVTGVEAEPGMVLPAGQPVLRVALDGPRDVVFSVPEDRVAQLRAAVASRPGALKVRLWGRDDAVPVQLREVAAAADPVTRTFLVKADLGRVEAKLGQTATVVLDLPAANDVIKLPTTALTEQGGKSVVWVLDPSSMTVNAVPVQPAGADGNEVVIAAGLSKGQEVVVAGVHTLSPGQKVKRYQPPRAAAPAPAAPAASH